MPLFTLPFSSPEASLATAGGKGLHLGELTRAGFPVPRGFIVSTAAYHAFVQGHRIQEQVVTLARQATPEDPRSLEETSARILVLFAGGEVPAEVADEVLRAYHALSPAGAQPATPLPVAVRSSATAEDLPGLSFAGQQETYLNVVGAGAVLEAMKECWASLWTARAIGYRARQGIPPDEVALAVVVQQMIAAESSGVLFTANPLTGRRDEMVIDASFGLGEAIVSGQVEADHYVVDASRGRITQRRLGAKALAILPHPGGGTERVAREPVAQAALSEEQILELARLAGGVAAHYGSPQDIEWAWAGGQLYLLQARPITALYPLPAVPARTDDLRVYFSFNSVQGIADPITPLGRDVVRMFFGSLPRALQIRSSARELMPDAGGRLFLDITDLARDPVLRRAILAGLARADPGARQSLRRLIEEGRLPARRVLKPGRVLRLLARALPLLRRGAAALRAPDHMRARTTAEGDRLLAQVRQRIQAAESRPAQLACMEEGLAGSAGAVFAAFLPVVVPSFASIQMVDRWLGAWTGAEPGAVLSLLRGVPGNVTTEMDLKLWATAQAIRADPAARQTLQAQPVETLAEAYQQGGLPPTAQTALAGFLSEYGMRAVGEIDIGRPRWCEDPTSILQTLQAYLQLEDPGRAPDVLFHAGAVEAERLAGEYVARVRRTRFGLLRAWLLGGAIRRLRVLGGLRESPKFYVIKIFAVYRDVLLALGRDLAGRGILQRPDDVFFVPFAELQRVARGEERDLQSLVAAGRAEYQYERGRRQVPRLLLSTGEVFYAGVGEEGGADVLVGEAVSPGVAEGRVRVVRDPRGERLEPGEILVCPATDPGWTPLFLTARGLVMEMGGLVTHGSVVAREYGIPAVVGVDQATTRLQTGQRVRVDGNRGRVTVLAAR